MQRFLFVTVLSIIIMSSGIAIAQNKVVVIPLNSQVKNAAMTCTGPDEVLSAGQCWKDRNLGATQVATSQADPLAYGDLYQWGRPSDGHQNRDSTPILGTVISDVPGFSNFIMTTTSPFDWRIPQNNNLWQGLGGINNPCPQGFRIPTKAEWETEIQSWGTHQNATGAFNSPLKLIMAGGRSLTSGVISGENTDGSYWASTGSAYNGVETSYYLKIIDISVSLSNLGVRASGFSVRCIKE